MAGSVATTKPAGSAFQQNKQIEKFLLSQATEMTQNILTTTVFPVSSPTINVLPQNVGIIKRFVVEIVATLTNNGGATATLTDTGLANLLSNVTLYDLQNNLRINTTGLHLHMLSCVKRRRPFAATADRNTASGNNRSQMLNVPPASWGVFQAPATIATTASGTLRAVFEIPLAYSDDDLRGAVFANVVNTQMNLQITFNQNVFSGTGTGDTTYCVYSGSTGVFTSAVVNIYQVFLDQLPVNKQTGAYILPQLSLNTVYEVKQTHFTAIGQGNDYPFAFTNFRDFYSAFIVFNNNGLSTGRTFGTDVNYWSLTTANFTNIFKFDPLYSAMLTREIMDDDLPAGAYYFSFRKKPIWTTQYGNQQINLNAATVNASGYADAMWEDMAIQNTLSGGSSLAG
jgi:hypothetical protein